MIYIGVDPGKKGGYAIIMDGNSGTYPWDDVAFALFIASMNVQSDILEEPIVCAVEKVGAMHGQGVTSMFSFGHSLGYIEGVLTAEDISYQLVPPATWKREFSLIGKDKAASVEVCRKLFPGVNLLPTDKCRKESDGMAEALLLAEYARRKM